MNRNSNGMSTGMALLCTLGILLFIGWMIDLGTPKCIKSGCDNDAKDGSSYCYLHDNSNYRYKSSTSYSGSSKSSGSSSTTKNSNTSLNSKSSSTTSNSKKIYSSGSSSSKKNYSSMASYDDGCEKWNSGTSGWPDRIVLLPDGKFGFVEVKAPGEEPRPLQLHRHKQLRQLGYRYVEYRF